MTILETIPSNIFLDENIAKRVGEIILQVVEKSGCRGILKDEVLKQLESVLMEDIRSGVLTGTFGFQRGFTTAEALDFYLAWLVEYRYLYEIKTSSIWPLKMGHSIYFPLDVNIALTLSNQPPRLLDPKRYDSNEA